MVFGSYHVISAVGVDGAGHKHVLGIQQGATENAAALEDLLKQLMARGVKEETQRLFVIDGAKALRAAIHRIFGPQHPVQRCHRIMGWKDLWQSAAILGRKTPTAPGLNRRARNMIARAAEPPMDLRNLIDIR